MHATVAETEPIRERMPVQALVSAIHLCLHLKIELKKPFASVRSLVLFWGGVEDCRNGLGTFRQRPAANARKKPCPVQLCRGGWMRPRELEGEEVGAQEARRRIAVCGEGSR